MLYDHKLFHSLIIRLLCKISDILNWNKTFHFYSLYYFYQSMEESDGMLITTLKDYVNIPEHIQALKDIRADQIFLISLKLLQYLKVDTNEVKSLSGKAQRFRSMAKLNQSLFQELQTQFQLNQLMNPSIPFLRKFLLIVINKLGSVEGQKGKGVGNDPVQKQREQKKQLKNWVSQEWIHPSLATKRHKYRGYVLPLTINKNFLKNNISITSQLNNPMLQNSTQSILSSTLSKHNQRVKQFEANEGISRRQNEEAALRLNNIVKANKQDWIIASNKLLKLKKKINQDSVESYNAPPTVVSIYKQELEQVEVQAEKKKQTEEVKPKLESRNDLNQNLEELNPLELMRRQAQSKSLKYEEQIKNILNELNERKQAIQNWEHDKETIQQKMMNDEQKIVKIKQQTTELKKKVEKRQVILSTLQGQANVEEQVKTLQKQIEKIETQVKTQVNSLQSEIKGLETEGKEKMQALNDLKAKLTRIEKDYERVCQQIAEKDQLKGSVKIMKSGISRNYYHKKISEMQSRWRETEKQTKKLRVNLQQLREKTKVVSTLNLRMETEIQNILTMDKNKNEAENKLLRDLMNKCKDAFNRTLNTLQQVNEVKIQTQDYEMKVHMLSGKNYKQNIEKITLAMQDLKRQINELSKSKSK